MLPSPPRMIKLQLEAVRLLIISLVGGFILLAVALMKSWSIWEGFLFEVFWFILLMAVLPWLVRMKKLSAFLWCLDIMLLLFGLHTLALS